jgi:hypothetical protein
VANSILFVIIFVFLLSDLPGEGGRLEKISAFFVYSVESSRVVMPLAGQARLARACQNVVNFGQSPSRQNRRCMGSAGWQEIAAGW